MKNRFAAALGHISKFFTLATIFVVPLVWLPVTLEAHELPKYTVLYAGVFFALLSYLLRAISLRFVSFRRTALDIPVLLLWAVVLATSVLSADQFTSFVGDYGILGVSFFGWSAFTLLYFLLTQHLTRLKDVYYVLGLLLCSISLAAALALAREFGITGPIFGLTVPGALPHAARLLSGLVFTWAVIVALGFLADKRLSLLVSIVSGCAFSIGVVGVFLWGIPLLWILLSVATGVLLMFFFNSF